MNFFRSLLFKINGKISKTKVVAIVGLVLTLLQTWGVIHLTPEQVTQATASIVALWAIFFRSGIDEDTEK